MTTTFENATTQSVDVSGTKFVFREMARRAGYLSFYCTI
jgi:hypothetical protein